MRARFHTSAVNPAVVTISEFKLDPIICARFPKSYHPFLPDSRVVHGFEASYQGCIKTCKFRNGGLRKGMIHFFFNVDGNCIEMFAHSLMTPSYLRGNSD